MNMFEVWLLLVLIPKLPFLFVPVAIVSAIASIIAIAWGLSAWENLQDEGKVQLYKERKIWDAQDEIKQESALKGMRGSKKVFKIGLISLCVSSLLVAAIPNRKEVAAIVLIPYVSNNPEFQKLPENMVGMLNDLIKEYRKELSPTKESDHE